MVAQVPYQSVDTVLIATIASLFIPLAVNFVTKYTASDGLKAVCNIVGVGLISVVALWINPSDVPITWQLCVNTFLASFATSFVAYKGLWKPTGVAGSIAAKTADFGVGSPPTMQTADKGAEDSPEVVTALRPAHEHPDNENLSAGDVQTIIAEQPNDEADV